MSDDGARVTFLRSSGPVDPINSLWVLDVAAGVERPVPTPASSATAATTGICRRRRWPGASECGRPGSGIVSYDADADLTAAVFTLGGGLWRVGLPAGDGPPEPLAAQPGPFDPRLSPDGARVAYAAGIGPEGDR